MCMTHDPFLFFCISFDLLDFFPIIFRNSRNIITKQEFKEEDYQNIEFLHLQNIKAKTLELNSKL